MGLDRSELEIREALLERARAYVDEHGVPTLTMAALAKGTGTPVEDLREHFEDTDDLVVALLARNRIRLRDAFVAIDLGGATSTADLARLMWKFYAETGADSRLFFEAYGMAIHNERYGEFILGINDWLKLMVDALIKRGIPNPRAAAFATLTLSVFRGAMLDLCATGERGRIDAAMELWFAATAQLAQP